MILGLLVLAAGPSLTLPPAPADIVVRAVRGRCDVIFAGSKLDGRGQRKLADGWPAGRPLRVAEPNGANYKCLTKLSLKLSEKGFNVILFVTPQNAP